MSKASIHTTRSLFDSPTNDAKDFWKQMNASDFSHYPLVIEGTFYIKSRKFFQDQTSCILAIRSTFLIFKKKRHDSNVEYIDLEEFMYRLELIGPNHKKYSSKYKHAFSLSIGNKAVEFYCKEKTQFNQWISSLQKFCLMTNFRDLYQIGDMLGSGGYGQVYLVENAATKMKYAGKLIALSQNKISERQQVMIKNEIKMLRKVDHPNIVKLYEVYETEGEIWMVMEMIHGEKLFDYIILNDYLRETEMAIILKQLLLVLHHLRGKDIIHRDIKPENILLFKTEQGKVQIKLIDFGLGTFNSHRDIIKKCGTAGYVAPEILKSEAYDFAADLYSVGIVTMVCLTGKPAFFAKTYEELLERNKAGIIRSKGKGWNRLSHEAKKLIRGLTDPNPASRISLFEALNHEWFRMNLQEDEKKEISTFLSEFRRMSIPQEGIISHIPVTTNNQAPVLHRAGSNSLSDNGTNFSNVSQSFITSLVLGGKNSMATLNSFYKQYSRESSISSEKPSISSLSQGGNPFAPKSIQKKLSAKENVLGLPNQKLLFDATHNARRRSISLTTPTHRDTTILKPNVDYKIQISIFDPFELEAPSSDDDYHCGRKYQELERNQFVVRKTYLL